MSAVPEAPATAASGRSSTACWPRALVLCLAVALCYANSLRVPFLLDDPRPGVPIDYSTRVLVGASFELNRALSGSATWSFHVFNALVHLACGLLLFGVLRRAMVHAAPRLSERTRTDLAFVTSLLWLCHPLQTASVTYLSQRAEALGAFFYLAVLYCFLRSASAERPRAWQGLALFALTLGFLTKETIATAPLLLWIFDALFLARGGLATLRVRRGFYVALALVTLGFAARLVLPTLLGDNLTAGLRLEEFGPLEYARTQPGVILHYLRLAFWPHPLCFDYGWPIAKSPSEYVPQTAGIAVLLGATLVLLARRSWIGFAGACFFVILAPTSSFVPIRDPAFEHRMYLPLAAVLVLAVAAGWWLAARGAGDRARSWGPLVAGALALALAAGTIRRNQDYGSEVELWQRTVAQAPHNARARGNLGAALLDAGRTEEAIRALLETLSLDTRDGAVSLAVSPVAYLKLGEAYARLEQPDRALPFYQRAVALCEWPDGLLALGTALLQRGDDAGGALQLQKYLALQPGDAAVHTRLAEVLLRAGHTEEARQHFDAALRLDPEREPAHMGLGTLLASEGQASEALEHVQRALAIPPDTAGERFLQGQLLDALGRFDESMRAFQETIRLAPELPAPYAAFARSACRRPEATQAERQEALRMASKAIALTGSAQAEFLEVGAEAHAALGEFEQAANRIEAALALPDAAANPTLASRLRAQLEDYRRRAGQEATAR